jgi:hypothetical protein
MRHLPAVSNNKSMALPLGKLERHANATVRVGAGEAKGRVVIKFESRLPTADSGKTVMPNPVATIYFKVSNELP